MEGKYLAVEMILLKQYFIEVVDSGGIMIKSVPFRILVLFAFSYGCENAAAATFYFISAEDAENAYIQNPQYCSSTIGSGGNLIEAGERYAGKCQGAGLPVEIAGTHKYLKYLRFRTDTTYSGTESASRTELAVTERYFPFNEKINIGFRLMIPDEASVTNESFYLMQMWQCAPAPPIAGIRMTRGFSHKINFMTRGDSREGSMMHFDLTPNVWHRFIIVMIVNPRDSAGTFGVYKDEDGTPTITHTSYGYLDLNTCNGGGVPPQHFRIKFGIYKGNGLDEGNKPFEVRFDDIRIGEYYDNVRPW